MDFRQLHYLLVVNKHRNITRAAEELYITQSALSLFIQKVENDFGAILFDRSTTPLTLTQAGEIYMESAQKILQENEMLNRKIRDITNHMTGKIRLGTSSNRAAYELPELFIKFSGRYPGIEVEAVTGSAYRLLEGLRAGNIDLLLLPYSEKYDMHGILTEQLYSEELVFAANRKCLTQEMYLNETTVKLKALEQLPYFALNQKHASRIYLNSFFRKYQIHPSVRMEFSDNITCYCMAAAGLGYAIVPYMITKLTNKKDDMELLSLGPERALWDIRMFFRKGVYLGQPEKDMIELAKEWSKVAQLP